jgi:hypothetical protein
MVSRALDLPPESQPDRVDPRVLLSLSDFAKRHKIARGSLHGIIHEGRIIPVLVGPQGHYQFINTELYDDYPFGRWPQNRPEKPEPAVHGPPATLINPKRLISLSDFARMKKVSRNTVKNNVDDGRITLTLLGPQGQYQFIDLDEYESYTIGRYGSRN